MSKSTRTVIACDYCGEPVYQDLAKRVNVEHPIHSETNPYGGSPGDLVCLNCFHDGCYEGRVNQYPPAPIGTDE